MLVICEDCAKKYHIDESRIQGKRAKFSCKACGHIVVVEKPEQPEAPAPVVPAVFPEVPPAAAAKDIPSVQSSRKIADAVAAVPAAVKGRGKPFLLPLLAVLTAGFAAVGGTFFYLYLQHVPSLINEESSLRSMALATAFEQAVKTPLLRKDYWLVSQETKRAALLPGVAYAAAVNGKGVVTAGFFNPQAGFDSSFMQRVKEKGFPVDVLAQHGLKTGAEEGSLRLNIGGLLVDDRVLALRGGDGEIHLGLPAPGTGQHVVLHLLASPLLLIPAGLALLVIGILLVLTNLLIIRPARSLTNTANRISLGELDLVIPAKGSRELRELALAVERMRHSVRIAVERLTARPQ
ncbi:zinc-ribbon domain-containing protein [Candidatus Electronema sp. JM]|uniref:zinc-ribbon domain-containing protein n=1 Tax=Candidatus Electronema sp. JM TaxID=3401571 RepID=UPI003AA92A73